MSCRRHIGAIIKWLSAIFKRNTGTFSLFSIAGFVLRNAKIDMDFDQRLGGEERMASRKYLEGKRFLGREPPTCHLTVNLAGR